MEYIDLCLIHYPVRLKGDKQMVFTSEDMIPLDMPTVWEAMEKCQSLGLAKSIGVSNFTCRKLADLLSHAKVPPAVNQVSLNSSYSFLKNIYFFLLDVKLIVPTLFSKRKLYLVKYDIRKDPKSSASSNVKSSAPRNNNSARRGKNVYL